MHVLRVQRLNMRGMRTQAVFGDDHRAVVCFQARVAVNLLGGKRARAIEGSKVVPLDTDHLF